jgi:hypothetical protein
MFIDRQRLVDRDVCPSAIAEFTSRWPQGLTVNLKQLRGVELVFDWNAAAELLLTRVVARELYYTEVRDAQTRLIDAQAAGDVETEQQAAHDYAYVAGRAFVRACYVEDVVQRTVANRRLRAAARS